MRRRLLNFLTALSLLLCVAVVALWVRSGSRTWVTQVKFFGDGWIIASERGRLWADNAPHKRKRGVPGLRRSVRHAYVAAGAAVLPAAWCVVRVRATIRRRWRSLEGLCPSCAYDLTGNLSGVCPECGVQLEPS